MVCRRRHTVPLGAIVILPMLYAISAITVAEELAPSPGNQNEIRTTPAAISQEQPEKAVPPVDAANETQSKNETGQGSAQEVDYIESIDLPQPPERLAERDPAFKKYFDVDLFVEAIANVDASSLADVALGLAEGERVFQRSHRSGVTSTSLVKRAAALALHKNDQTTIARLEQVAGILQKTEWKDAIGQAAESTAISREPISAIPLDSLAPESAIFLADMVKAIDTAFLATDKAALEQMKTKIASSVDDESLKNHVVALIDRALGGISAGGEPLDDVLKEFTGGSRDVLVDAWIPGEPYNYTFNVYGLQFKLVLHIHVVLTTESCAIDGWTRIKNLETSRDIVRSDINLVRLNLRNGRGTSSTEDTFVPLPRELGGGVLKLRSEVQGDGQGANFRFTPSILGQRLGTFEQGIRYPHPITDTNTGPTQNTSTTQNPNNNLRNVFRTACGATLTRRGPDLFELRYDSGTAALFRHSQTMPWGAPLLFYVGQQSPPYGIDRITIWQGYIGKFYRGSNQPTNHAGWNGQWVQ